MVITQINGIDITSRVISISNFKEFNDETFIFSGVFRRSNVQITCDNNTGFFDSNRSLFSGTRDGAEVKIFYQPNNPNKPHRLIFLGYINEGSTTGEIKTRQINFTVTDALSLFDKLVLKDGDQLSIDRLYRTLRGTYDIAVNKHYLACFLSFFLSKDSYKLNKLFNVFENNRLRSGSYPTINTTIESIFPPNNSYYSLNNTSALNILNELCRSVNSYLSIDILDNDIKLFIKARATDRSSKKTINQSDIINIFDYNDGFNKIYNSIIINNSPAYDRQSSIDLYGEKILNIVSYAPASQALANSYLDFYSTKKQECSLAVKLNFLTLDIFVGNVITINQSADNKFLVKDFSGSFYVANREIDFNTDIIIFRLREV